MSFGPYFPMQWSSGNGKGWVNGTKVASFTRYRLFLTLRCDNEFSVYTTLRPYISFILYADNSQK